VSRGCRHPRGRCRTSGDAGRRHRQVRPRHDLARPAQLPAEADHAL